MKNESMLESQSRSKSDYVESEVEIREHWPKYNDNHNKKTTNSNDKNTKTLWTTRTKTTHTHKILV
jgi:hypothetical protein